MPKVLVTPHMLQRQAGPYKDVLEAAGLEVVYPPVGANTLEETVIAELLTPDIVGMLASTEPMNRRVISASSLKIIARLGVGYDSVDIQAAIDHGTAVTITPGTLEASVAELTVGMLLCLTRDLIGKDAEVRRGDWQRAAGPRLAGKTFGLVGAGRIGRAVAQRIAAFDMKVQAYDPFADPGSLQDLGIEAVSEFSDLARNADVLSLHLPCTPDSKGMVSEEILRNMKPNSILINLGRGGLVDEQALAKVLGEGHLLGAALDVFEQEPLPLDSPLLNAPRLLLSSHMGGIDADSAVLASRLAAQCIVDIYQQRWPDECLVNPEVKSGWQ